jgi:hypothetical protein
VTTIAVLSLVGLAGVLVLALAAVATIHICGGDA